MVLKKKREDSEQVQTQDVGDSSNSLPQLSGINNEPTPSPRKFKCKTCNMEFSKFQALGGHSASHKKPSNLTNNSQESDESKMHECSICGARFFIGQALGGHMRKHRELLKDAKTNLARTRHRVVHEVPATSEAESASNKPRSEKERLCSEKSKRRKVNLDLDLNLTPAGNDLNE